MPSDFFLLNTISHRIWNIFHKDKSKTDCCWWKKESEVYSEHRQTSKTELFVNIVHEFQRIIDCFCRKLHLRCLTKFYVSGDGCEQQLFCRLPNMLAIKISICTATILSRGVSDVLFGENSSVSSSSSL